MSSNIYKKIKVAQFIKLSQNLHQCYMKKKSPFGFCTERLFIKMVSFHICDKVVATLRL